MAVQSEVLMPIITMIIGFATSSITEFIRDLRTAKRERTARDAGLLMDLLALILSNQCPRKPSGAGASIDFGGLQAEHLNPSDGEQSTI